MNRDLKEEIRQEMVSYFNNDTKRINHALTVLKYAEAINHIEKADSLIVTIAALLHDIGIPNSEKKYNSSAGNYQEIEGPIVAREILKNYPLTKTQIDHICDIIANHHSAKNIDTPEFRVIWDADWIVNIPDELPNERNILKSHINKLFKTTHGKEIAESLYLT